MELTKLQLKSFEAGDTNIFNLISRNFSKSFTVRTEYLILLKKPMDVTKDHLQPIWFVLLVLLIKRTNHYFFEQSFINFIKGTF
jgi:hypothetical protein